MNTHVVRTDTLEELEQTVTALKAEGWTVSGGRVPFWENGQHCLEIQQADLYDTSSQTHCIEDFTDEARPSLNELSDLCGS